MKLTFLYHPVIDLEKAVGFYRDVLGWDEAWREGETTAAFAIPDSTVQVMLDVSDSDEGGPCGFYEVDDVDAFHATNRDTVDWVELPEDLPPMRRVQRSSGHPVPHLPQPWALPGSPWVTLIRARWICAMFRPEGRADFAASRTVRGTVLPIERHPLASRSKTSVISGATCPPSTRRSAR